LPRLPRTFGAHGRRGLALAAVAAIPLGLLPGAASAGGDDRPVNMPGHGDVRSSYYTDWSVYSGYTLTNAVANGQIANLNELQYAFVNVAPNTSVAGSPIECQLGDSWADTDMPYGDGTGRPSIDGTTDNWSGMQGNFKQILELKKKFPNVRVVASLGGFTWSSYFSDAALTPAARQHLVQSCVNLLIKGNVPGYAPGAAKGVFDGIDIDWEYPGSAGASTTNGNGNPTARPQDTQDFTALLQQFRTDFDAYSHSTHGQHYLLTAALSANPSKIALLQVHQISQLLDQLNVMDYDFHGPWEATGPTDFQSELFPSATEAAAVGAQNQFSVDQSINAYLNAGAPRDKLIVGIPFYGHGWTGVQPGSTNGLYQPATGPTADGGTANWNVIQKLGYQPHRDPATGGYWVYDPASTNLYVVDDPVEIVQKMQYVEHRGLGGAFSWSLDGDDTAGSLVAAMATGLAGNHH
jgi:chitinase